MSPGRQDVFDLALLISQQLAQQESQAMSAADRRESGATAVQQEPCEADDEFVMVQAADAAWPVFGAAPQPMMMRQAAMATPAAMPHQLTATVPCAAFAQAAAIGHVG